MQIQIDGIFAFYLWNQLHKARELLNYGQYKRTKRPTLCFKDISEVYFNWAVAVIFGYSTLINFPPKNHKVNVHSLRLEPTILAFLT